MKTALLSIVTILFIFTEINGDDVHKDNQTSGFFIEIFDESSSSTVLKKFICFEDVKNLPLESFLIKDKEGQADQTLLGANLCDLLEKTLNIHPAKITKISASAADGFNSVVFGELLSAIKTALFVYETKDDEDQTKKLDNLRLVYPELRNMYNVDSPEKMVFFTGKKQQPANRYGFYFTANKTISARIKNNKRSIPCLALDDIFSEFKLPREDFRVITTDGLLREYMANKIIANYVLQNHKQDKWKISGVNVPMGLKIRNVFFILIAGKGLFLKSLTKEEQSAWHNLFWNPVFREITDMEKLKINLIMNNGESVLSGLMEDFKEKQISLYRLFEMELKNYPDTEHIVLSW